jgi:hypothetical protein
MDTIYCACRRCDKFFSLASSPSLETEVRERRWLCWNCRTKKEDPLVPDSEAADMLAEFRRLLALVAGAHGIAIPVGASARDVAQALDMAMTRVLLTVGELRASLLQAQTRAAAAEKMLVEMRSAKDAAECWIREFIDLPSCEFVLMGDDLWHARSWSDDDGTVVTSANKRATVPMLASALRGES